MAKEGSVSILKEAFDAGYKAFGTCEKNAKGFFQPPTNSFPKDSLPSKEWERGYNRAYTDCQKRVKA